MLMSRLMSENAARRGVPMDDSDFIRINSPDLWEGFKKSIENLSIESECLRLKTTLEYQFNSEIDKSDYEIMDIAVDECDIVYCLAKESNGRRICILTYDQRLGMERITGCKPGCLPVDLISPAGIGIDTDTIYIADSGDGRLIALARRNFQIRWILSEDLKQCKDGKNLAYLKKINDLTVGKDGNIYVLEDKRVLQVNRNGIDINEIINGLKGATDIVIDGEEDIYILEEKYIRVFRDKKQIKQIGIGSSSKGLAIDSNKNIFFGQRKSHEPTIFKIESTDPENMPVPLWSFRDKTSRLINDSKANLYILNADRNKLAFLEYKKVNKKNNGIFQGTYISKPIDSHKLKTHWHRYVLEGEFIAGTKVDFSYYISNSETDVPEDKWLQGFSSTSSIQEGNTLDFLFQDNIEGRYLWFKISLIGNEDEKSSPKINSLTIFFPKISYIDYLPSIYRGNNPAGLPEDTATSSFIKRFLSIFESTFYDIDFKIDNLAGFLDAWGAPREFLSWLGSWLAIPMEDNFSDEMKRLYIHLAIRLYKQRGTRKGLEETIALFLYINKNPDSRLENILINYQIEKPFIIETFNIDTLCENEKTNNKKLHNENTIYFPPYKEAIRPRLFRWEEVPGKDNCLLKEFLAREFDMEWIKNAQIKKMYLFRWDDIQDEIQDEKNNELKRFLKKRFGIEGVKTIEKSIEEGIIKLSFNNGSLTLALNEEKSKVGLEIDDGRTCEFSAVKENSSLDIYDNSIIHIFSEEKSIEITLNEKSAALILKNMESDPEVKFENQMNAIYHKGNLLFVWEKVPGSDEKSFREYLWKFAGSWVETAKITKSYDNTTICVSTGERSIDIILKKLGDKRILDIIGRHPYELQVRKEHCRHFVYGKEIPLSNVLFGNDPFGFYVLLKDPTVDENSLSMVKKIIEEQKPAYTCYGLKVLEPRFYLSMHTYLGVNTYLTKPVFIMQKTSVIGRDTVLDDKEDAGQVGMRSRAGIDTKII